MEDFRSKLNTEICKIGNVKNSINRVVESGTEFDRGFVIAQAVQKLYEIEQSLIILWDKEFNK